MQVFWKNGGEFINLGFLGDEDLEDLEEIVEDRFWEDGEERESCVKNEKSIKNFVYLGERRYKKETGRKNVRHALGLEEKMR